MLFRPLICFFVAALFACPVQAQSGTNLTCSYDSVGDCEDYCGESFAEDPSREAKGCLKAEYVEMICVEPSSENDLDMLIENVKELQSKGFKIGNYAKFTYCVDDLVDERQNRITSKGNDGFLLRSLHSGLISYGPRAAFDIYTLFS